MFRYKFLMFLCVSLAIAAPFTGSNLANADPGVANESAAGTKGKMRSTTHVQRVEAAKRAAARKAAAQRETVTPRVPEGVTK